MRKILTIGLVLIIAAVLNAQETVVLQQGLNGYIGAMDTHISNVGAWSGDNSAEPCMCIILCES